MAFEPQVTVIGGGLAGCEAAYQLATRGIRVSLVDMKPIELSPAHHSPLLCELVCSNSLRSNDPIAPAGLLKRELRGANSLVIECADLHKVPAGSALAVDRFAFARAVTMRLALHENVRIERRLLDGFPEGRVVVATGPLTGGRLAAEIQKLFAGDRLYFYDAIAPIVAADSVDPEHSFRASRWGKNTDGGDGDYINCPVDRDTYEEIVGEILIARKVVPHDFEEPKYFEGCLPIEVMASRGLDVLRYGPMRPVGLWDPRTGKRPHALVQLRPENRYLTAYNLVGFQSRLAYPEQKRIFSLIPALRNAEFLRFGSIHRNTYIDSPSLLDEQLRLRQRPEVSFAGLISGVEGYIESCAMGLMAGLFVAAELRGESLEPLPETTALGGLLHHLTRARGPGEAFVPTNINYGLVPPPEHRVKKKERKSFLSSRAGAAFSTWADKNIRP